jgi:Tfp pilus assembly protein PilZ
MKYMPKRNTLPRRTSYIIAKYTVKEGTFRDVIKNIGAGGLFVRTSRKVAIGQTITLHFPLFSFEQNIRVSGTVSRMEPLGFAVTFDEKIEGLICKKGQFPEIVHEGDRSPSK